MSRSLKPAWSTEHLQGQPGLYSKILSQNYLREEEERGRRREEGGGIEKDRRKRKER